MNKRIIQVEVDHMDLSGFTGKELIEQIQNLESTYEKHGGVFFEEQTKHHNYSEDDYTYIAVMINREETEDECNNRITAENAIKERNLSYKRKQLEQLKAELGE